MQLVFLIYQVEGYQKILKLSFKPLTKRGLELASLPHFLFDFWRKIFILLYSINWPTINFTIFLSLL